MPINRKIIIDTCCIASVVNSLTPADKIIRDSLGSPLVVVIGGDKFRKEISGVKSFSTLLKILEKTGYIDEYADADVEAVSKRIKSETVTISGKKSKKYKSNDSHILALIILALPYLIRSEDANLKKDVKAYHSGCKIVPVDTEFLLKTIKSIN